MKDIRVILTTGNSEWGVISKIVGSNTYENVISFNGDENLRNEFVGLYLFDGNLNWKDLFNDESTKTKELTMIDEITLDYRYTVKDDEDKYEFLNKDTLIMRYTDKNNEYVYMYYAINNVRNINHNVISYSAEKDIMFTHFDELNFKGETTIIKAHTKRLKPNFFSGSGEFTGKVSLVKDGNILTENDLLFAQPTIETIDDNFVDYENDIIPGKYYIIYSSLNEGEEGVVFEEIDGIKHRLPYKIFVGILGNSTLTPPTFNGNKMGDFMKKFGSAPTTQSISFTDIAFIPYTSFTDNDYEVSVSDETLSWFDFGDETGGIWELKDISYLPETVFFKASGDSSVFDYTHYSQPKNIENEVKIKLSQFTKYMIDSSFSDNPQTINQNFLDNDEFDIQLKSFNSFSVEGVKSFVYTDSEKINKNVFKSRKGLILDNHIEIPLDTDLYKEYASNNKVGKTTAYATGAVKGAIAGGASGAIAGSVIPGVGNLVGGAVGAGVGIVKGIGNHAIEMSDLKNSPNQPKSTSENYHIGLETIKANNLETRPKSLWLSKLSLPEQYKQIVYDYLYASGYTIRKIDKIDNWLNTRYYFNHIQTSSVFSNIGLSISAQQKQIISDSFENGITVWYYRDKDTFKGILNYEYENMEMDLLPYVDIEE